MRFDWPAPGVVVVAEKVLKKGVTAKLRYELHLCPKQDAIIVHHRNFRIATLAGVPADDPQVREAVEEARPLMSLIPAMSVKPDGQLDEIMGSDAMLKRFVADLPSEEERARAQKIFANPRVIAMMNAKFAESWSAWVGVWRLYAPNGEPVQPFTVSVPTPEGGRLERELQVERVSVEGRHLRLRVVQQESNDQLGADTLALLGEIAEQPEHADAMQKHMESMSMERVTRWEIVTDPKTLQPEIVHREQKTTISLPGKPPRTQEERHDYRFDWTAGRSISPICD